MKSKRPDSLSSLHISLPNFKPLSIRPEKEEQRKVKKRNRRQRRTKIKSRDRSEKNPRDNNDDEAFQREGQFLLLQHLTPVLLSLCLAGVSGDRTGEADPARVLRREGEVPDGSGGRGRPPARQGTCRGCLRLRPCSPGQELYS